MSTIINLFKLNGIVPAADIEKLEAGAALHKRHSNIVFKIISVDNVKIDIRAKQGRHLSENYADKAVLVQRTKELFGKFISGIPINVHPVPYSQPIINVVTPEWLQDKMLKKGVKFNDLVTDTGLDKTNISAWVNGKRDMSQIVKAMFYFYFTGR